MKKNGFTLAEVLVVLGIVGVVAALTLPSLMSNTTSAQIGPKLAKAVAMFDQANTALLNEQGADSLTETDLLSNKYQKEIIKYLKSAEGGSITNTPPGFSSNSIIATITAKDGTVYQAYSNGAPSATNDPAHSQLVGTVIIDIDGNSGPGEPGTDLFAFTWFADGSLRPYGGTGSKSIVNNWTTACPKPSQNGDYLTPSNYWACAGHVFENNLKVQYE